MSTFNTIKKVFRDLSEGEKEKVFREVYGYSKEMKIFLEGLLLGESDGEAFVSEMEKETLGKVYRKGDPKLPNGKTVRSILARAKKARVSLRVMMRLEVLASRGFIEFLNEYGGGPDSFDELAANHFEAYLRILQDDMFKDEREKLFGEARIYLKAKRNMYRDELDSVFEEITGMSV